MDPHLLEQVAALFAGEGFDQLLFGGGQDALEPDGDQIADQVSVDLFRAAAHVVLFKATNPFANRGFDFPLRFHGDLAFSLFSGHRAWSLDTLKHMVAGNR
jgi:hypothetical protein